MTRSDTITPIELAALLAVLRLGKDAYGMTIRDEIEARTGKQVSVTAVYGALERLEQRGWVSSWLSDPLPERGGRARRHYKLLAAGEAGLRTELETHRRLWEGLERHPALKRPAG